MRPPAAVLLLTLTVAACGWQPPLEASQAPTATPTAPSVSPSTSSGSSAPSGSAEPSASTRAAQLLVTLGYRGGHCRNGPCDRTVAIDADGGVHQVAPEQQTLGELSPELFTEVRRQLSLTDVGALGSRPFTGECPVNFDGQELIYTFHGATGDIRLASCEVELDPAHPLLVAIENALGSIPAP